jgi:hypothetical protein
MDGAGRKRRRVVVLVVAVVGDMEAWMDNWRVFFWSCRLGIGEIPNGGRGGVLKIELSIREIYGATQFLL